MTTLATSAGTPIDLANLDKLAGPELVRLYNELAAELGDVTSVKRFENRQAGAVRVGGLVGRVINKRAAEAPALPEITDGELAVLRAVARDENTPLNGGEPSSPSDTLTWSAGIQVPGMSAHQVAGILSSLGAKDLATTDGETVGLTSLGLQVYKALADRVVEAPASEPAPKEKAGKARGFRFVFPIGPELKKVREGSKRAILEQMLSSPEGATFEECLAATWGQDTRMTPDQQRRTTYEGIRLLHYYSGYGMFMDADGKIHLKW